VNITVNTAHSVTACNAKECVYL